MSDLLIVLSNLAAQVARDEGALRYRKSRVKKECPEELPFLLAEIARLKVTIKQNTDAFVSLILGRSSLTH
jgi:hypothetical protein